MKALSIREPWAGFIIHGKKTIELRTWRTNYRGPVLVHRSGKNGGIVGIVEIEDIIKIESPMQFRALRDKHHAPDTFYKERLYGWVLKNAKPVEFIPCKGRLGLWEPSNNILKKVFYGVWQ
jgi:predicted transcriptional regulator